MTPLRAKMIRELELHRKAPKTIEAYVTAVAQLGRYYGRSPEKISLEEVRDFLHHLITVLKPRDIHADRMLIRVDRGKGHKDRYTLLPPRLLEELRTYWRAYRPQIWLFEGARAGCHLAVATAQRVFDRAKERAGVHHGKEIHCLRHSFATHLMEAGVPLPVIQHLMAHRCLSTTAKYLHVTGQQLGRIQSRLELLRRPEDKDLQE